MKETLFDELTNTHWRTRIMLNDVLADVYLRFEYVDGRPVWLIRKILASGNISKLILRVDPHFHNFHLLGDCVSISVLEGKTDRGGSGHDDSTHGNEDIPNDAISPDPHGSDPNTLCISRYSILVVELDNNLYRKLFQMGWWKPCSTCNVYRCSSDPSTDTFKQLADHIRDCND